MNVEQYENGSNNLGLELPHGIYNGLCADIDGDQIAVHLPVTLRAQEEAGRLVSSVNNQFSVADGSFSHAPRHECLGGLYLATDILEGTPMPCKSMSELEHKFELKLIKLGTPIEWRADGERRQTCYGRLLIEEQTRVVVGKALGKNYIKEYQGEVCKKYPDDVVENLGFMQTLGYSVATQSCPSVCLDSLSCKEFEDTLDRDIAYLRGIQKTATTAEFYKEAQRVLDDAYDRWLVVLGNTGLQFYAKAASRLSSVQVRQLAVAKGVQVDVRGNPTGVILGNYTRGLSVHEYVESVHGARAAQVAKLEVTPESGYLTRRLVAAGRDLVITEHDCGTKRVLHMPRVEGHCSATGELITRNGEGEARSPITCTAHGGICAVCYGIRVETGEFAPIGLPIGILAGQSLSERITQASMKKKHESGAGRLVSEEEQIVLAPCSGRAHVTEDYVSVGARQFPLRPDTALSVEDGDFVKKGDTVATAILLRRDALWHINCLIECKADKNSIISTAAGEVSFSQGAKGTVIFVNGKRQGVLHRLPAVWSGEYVEEGDVLSEGAGDVKKLFANDPEKCFFNMLASLSDSMQESGLPAQQHIEMAIRAMTELVDTEEGLSYRRFHPDADMTIRGITRVCADDPTDAKALSFGYVESGIERLTTTNNTQILGAVSAIMRGGKQ